MNRIPVLILQHPQESREALSSVPLIVRTLDNVKVHVGLSWPNLKSAWGESCTPGRWVVLYLGGKGQPGSGNGPQKKEVLQFIKGAPDATAPLEGLVAIDGSWSQAKAIWWRNPWLLKLKRAALNPLTPSLYGKLRREPRRECVSTLEAVGLALTALGESPEVERALLGTFKEFLKNPVRLKLTS